MRGCGQSHDVDSQRPARRAAAFDALVADMYERFLDQLWFSIPFMTLLMISVWYRNRAVKKGWVTQARLDEILSHVRVVLIVGAVLAFCVYYILIPHPPW